MARPVKQGLQRFSIEVHIFEDIKIRKIIRYKGGQGTLVYIKLLCMAYENGYFVHWDEELPFVISEATGLDETYVRGVIEYLIELGLFSEPMFKLRGILTSTSIQDRYAATCKNLKRSPNINPLFVMVSTEETPVTAEETPVFPEETPVIPEESTQNSKVKNCKEKKGKSTNVDKGFKAYDFPLPFDAEEFREVWKMFCDHRKAIKSPLTEHAAKLVANKLSKVPERYARAMLEKTIEGGKYPTVYDLKDWEMERIDKRSGIMPSIAQAPSDPIKRKYMNDRKPEPSYE